MSSDTVSGVPVTNLLDPAMIADPFPVYARLRRESPIAPVRAPIVRKTGYLVTRYDDVLAVHTDPSFSSDLMANASPIMKRRMPRLFRVLTDSMVFKDDPEHKRLRGLVNKAFTPKRVQALGDEMEIVVDGLVDRLVSLPGPVDLVEEFAVSLPMSIIATMLGVGDEDRERFRRDVHKMVNDFAFGPLGLLKVMPSSRRLLRLFDELAADRRAHPDDGLIAAMLQAKEGDDELDDDEIVAMIYLLLLAGHDTTANLIGGGVLALLDNPEQLARLRETPELIDSAVEELLRYTSPVPCGTTRFATTDVELSGTTIPKGSQVLAMLISANRDEDVFDHPEELDLARSPNRHLAFAFGSHFCLGNQLARTEARLAIKALVQRFPEIELAVPRDQIRIKPNPSLRGPVSVPLHLRTSPRVRAT